jgi:hypothetical protein
VVTPQGTHVQACRRVVRPHGVPTHRVSLVRHGSGTTLAQVATDEQRNELSAIPPRFSGRDLYDTIVTSDARHTQRRFASTIHDGGRR